MSEPTRSLGESIGPGLADVSGPLDAFEEDVSLLDVVDHLIGKGCVLTGELVLGLADIDLVYLELSVLLCSVDRLREAREGG